MGSFNFCNSELLLYYLSGTEKEFEFCSCSNDFHIRGVLRLTWPFPASKQTILTAAWFVYSLEKDPISQFLTIQTEWTATHALLPSA